MDEHIKSNETTNTHADVSRRACIKGVIGSGAAAFSTGHLFRSSLVDPGLLAQGGFGERLITLNVNGQQRRVDVSKQEMLAWESTGERSAGDHIAGFRSLGKVSEATIIVPVAPGGAFLDKVG